MHRVLLVAVAMSALCACPNEQERDRDLPLMTALRFDGPARDNPRVLLFRVDFRDGDGDLSAGTLAILLNGKPATLAPQPMQDIFLRSGLGLQSVGGTLLFELQVQIPDEDRPPEGSTFTVGVLATDGAGHESNSPTVTLEIGY